MNYKTAFIISLLIVVALAAMIVNQSTNLRDYISKYNNSESERKQLSSDMYDLRKELSNIKSTVSAKDAKVKELETKVIELETKLKGTLPYLGAKNNQLKLVNYYNTHNPTWNELKSFLLKDTTDKLPYIKGVRVCGDFAELLHNNAEIYGIRCGFIVIYFQGGTFIERTSGLFKTFELNVPHAINVFYTSDFGLIYISSQGPTEEDISSNCQWDKVFFLEVGKELGSICINDVTSFNYRFYENKAGDWESYTKTLHDYNDEVMDYNRFVLSKTFVEGTADYIKVMKWGNDLDKQKSTLKSLRAKLPKCMFEPMGVVDKYETYW